MATRQCLSYTDFLGISALQFKTKSHSAYTDHICVYALSANRTASYDDIDIDNNTISAVTATPLTSLNWQTLINEGKFKFVKANSAEFMCYKFKQSDITTESDNEPDLPYSYEELFNQNVLNNISASTKMQYKYIYSEYQNSTSQPVPASYNFANTKDMMLNNFYVTNNMQTTADFNRADYYKFFVPETDIVHNRSCLELTDDSLAAIGNNLHESFNCLLYCVNPNFDAATAAGTNNHTLPKGFTNGTYINAVPISLCTYSQDIILAGNNILFEPNLNGIVTVE